MVDERSGRARTNPFGSATRRPWRWCAARLLGAAAAVPAAAQTSGTIEGAAVDGQGLAVPGAT
ncbi:MAG: hypothetical protein OXG35_01465, partial [Acidobacteria bacterium]|nr:hypothetical protein [Acidobacteriota bacterium]